MQKFFDSIKFYSRRQESMTFNFYFDKNKQLIAETVRDGQNQQLQTDLPRDFQIALDEGKIDILRTIFEKCYFSIQGGRILVNARGLGGWDKEIHNDKTCEWAKNDDFSENDAKIIADSCQKADEDWKGLIELLITFFTSDRHYGGDAWNKWMTKADPRFKYANSKLEDAIILQNTENECKESLYGTLIYNQWDEGALKLLGQGLHALQDAFAHNPDQIVFCINKSACIQKSGADNITINSKGLEYTQQATRIYFECFKLKNKNLLESLDSLLNTSREDLPSKKAPTLIKNDSLCVIL